MLNQEQQDEQRRLKHKNRHERRLVEHHIDEHGGVRRGENNGYFLSNRIAFRYVSLIMVNLGSGESRIKSTEKGNRPIYLQVLSRDLSEI